MSTEKRSYGTLTDVSKFLNEALGDETGRSVSMRTAQGFKALFKLPEMNDEDAEDIVHASMLGAGLLLNSKDDGVKITGAVLSFALLFCYQAGIENGFNDTQN